MEIERKFLVDKLPADYAEYEHYAIEQGYLCRKPVVRVRRMGDDLILTYKGEGLMAREEYNMPLNEDSFITLMDKCDGTIIKKTRYIYPLGKYHVDLDIFTSPRKGLIMAEVEFSSTDEAYLFEPPEWFGTEVTNDPFYHNSNF